MGGLNDKRRDLLQKDAQHLHVKVSDTGIG